MASGESGPAAAGARSVKRRDARLPVDGDIEMRIVPAAVIERSLQRREFDAGGARWTIARPCEFLRAPPDRGGKILGLGDAVDQSPRLRAIGAHAFDGRAEHVGEITSHAALVGQPRKSAGAG